MKLLVGLALVTLLTAVIAEVDEESRSHFYKTFNKLHQEPPPQKAADTGRFLDVKTEWITQKLDHFDEKNDKTWEMRYLSSAKHFKEGGPIFIYVGGEWTISSGMLVGGHMFDMAKEHKGYMLYTEHRYYGKSHPFENLSTDNLKYLHVKQALHDLNHVITTVKKNITGLENSKVIIVGGSYSATMVTWFQIMFPGVAAGSWASSAPLLAKLDFVEYKEIVGSSIKQMGGEACYNRIENAVATLEDMLVNERVAEVKSLFKLCNNFDANNDLDVYTFFSEISEIFAGIVQGHSGNTIQNACKQIMAPEDDVQGLASYVLKQTIGKANCVDLSYKAWLETMSDTSDLAQNMRQWIYQTCNEYGWYQTSGSKLQPFGKKFPVDLFINACRDAYKSDFTNFAIEGKIQGTNEFFGALNPGTDNVYFTHGGLDPWRAMGLQEKGKATILPEYAHCKDFGSISKNDSEEMRASKEAIAALVRKWVA